MSKLRTLKDIEDRHLYCTPIFLTIAIREEAIKWVRYYREEHGDNLPSCGFSPDIEFMKFFNLTDDDVNVGSHEQ